MEDRSVDLISKKGILFMIDNGRVINYKPWLGDFFSPFYDSLMSNYVFPKKLSGDIKKHIKILKDELSCIKDKNVLELGTGSGNITGIISKKNCYEGIDISYRLLKIALLKFRNAGFNDYRLYMASAENLPICDKSIDLCICNLSINFFNDLDLAIKEIKRVVRNGGSFFCSVPITERIKPGSNVRGRLLSEKELKDIFEKYGFKFKSLTYKNGAIFYFRANNMKG